MSFRHSFEWLSTTGEKKVFLFFLILTVLVLIGIQVSGEPLKTEVAPAGIVSFELAGELVKARAIVDSWGHNGQIYAGLNLGLDYLFLFSYMIAIGLGAIIVGRSRSGWELPAIVLAWGVVFAALLDALENFALIHVLLGTNLKIWPVIAHWCAIPKFMIIAVALIFIITGTIAGFFKISKN